MKIGLSFNFWMVVIPMLYLIGLGIGYWLVWSGREKPLRRPFHWRSDLPMAVTILSYSIVVGITFMVMLFVESRHGIIELLGRDTLEAVFMMPVVVMICGIVMFFVTLCGMREMRNWHIAKLKRTREKLHGQAIVAIARAEVTGDKSVQRRLGTVVHDDGQCQVIALHPERLQKRWRFYQVWNSLKRAFRRLKDKHDPMALPEHTVRYYQQRAVK